MASVTPTHKGPDGKAAPGTKWLVRYRDPNGRSRKKVLPRKVDADRFAERMGADMQAGDWVDPVLRRALFDHWAEAWQRGAVKLAPSTRRTYWQILNVHLMPFFGGRKMVSIDFVDIEELINARLEGGLSPKYVRNMVSVMALIMDGPVKAKARRDNPALGHKIPRRRRKLTPGDVLDMRQLRRLIDQVADPYKPAVWILALSGMRPSELAGLRVGSIDFARRRVAIDSALVPVHAYGTTAYHLAEGPPKTDAGYRDIPLPGWLVDELAEMLAGRVAERGGPVNLDEPLFTQPKGGPLNVGKFRELVILPALRAAGLPTSVRTYDLRHSHASMLIDQGASVLAVAHRLGHADPAVTLRNYGRLFEGVQEHLTDQIDELVRLSATTGAEVVPMSARRAVGEDTKKTRDDTESVSKTGNQWEPPSPKNRP